VPHDRPRPLRHNGAHDAGTATAGHQGRARPARLGEPGWQGFPEAVDIIVAAAANPGSQPWGPRLFFDDDGALVGNGGWKGPPDNGRVEVGYAVAPARRRQGIATAVVRTLLEEARAADVNTVIAHTLAEPNPSTRVLERCGFTRCAELVDPDEGPVWQWERKLRDDR
jgi:RimJ/RimL family protein N-acetyltransferase